MINTLQEIVKREVVMTAEVRKTSNLEVLERFGRVKGQDMMII